METVTLLGLGIMGTGMAHNLLKAGFSLTVYNRTREKANALAGKYADTQFALKWMHKDMTYALRAADEHGTPMPTLAAAREVYRMARNLGLDEADFAAVIEAVRQHT